MRGIDPRQLKAQLMAASWLGLLACAGINFAHNGVRVLRWGLLLHPVRERVRFRPMFASVVLGYMVTWVAPGRLGELVRPALLSGREKLPIGPCMGTVIVDRLLDGLAVVLLFAVGLAVTPMPPEAAVSTAAIRGTSVVAGLVVIGLCVSLIVATSSRRRIERALEKRGSPVLLWIGRSMLAVSRGADALKRPGLLLGVVVHTVLAWLMIALATWVGIRACGIDVPFGAVLIILPLLALGVTLPTPGGAGGYHAAMTFGLSQLFGVAEAQAVGASVLIHLMIIFPVILVGGGILIVEHIPFRDLLEAGRQLRHLGAAEGSAVPPVRAAENAS